MKSAWQTRQLLAACSIISSSYLINIVCLLRSSAASAASEALDECTIFLLGSKLGEFRDFHFLGRFGNPRQHGDSWVGRHLVVVMFVECLCVLV